MVRFNEQQQIDSVRGALALRSQIEPIVDQFCRDGYRNICWLGIGGYVLWDKKKNSKKRNSSLISLTNVV